MSISMKDVKKLREETGARILDCKKALESADGDFKKAIAIVAEKGLARAEKNVDRETKSGLITSYVHNNGLVAAMVEIQCETDFVAQNDEFKKMAYDIAMQITAMGPENVEELLKQDFVKEPSKTVELALKALSGKIGEKMVIKRFVKYVVGEK